MASAGNSRPTGTIPKSTRNNSNIPQEVVTPTRRDVNVTNQSAVDWLPVSEHNGRSTQNRARKSTNLQAENEFHDLDLVNQERGSRFVPVRPQPRSLVLRQRDIMGDHSDESFGNAVGSNSPHTNHAAVMIVNPTTPNSNQTTNLTSSVNRNNARGGSLGRDSSMYPSNTVSVCPHPTSSSSATNKSNNIHNSEHSAEANVIFQNGNGQNIHHESQISGQSETLLSRSEAIRASGDNIIAACPDAARVEQRLGQIREYIRVTSSLVESMRNSEDEDGAIRPTSAQSSFSAFSDNDLYQNEMKTNMDLTQIRLAAALQEQRRLLKYQAEAKEQLADLQIWRNVENMSSSHNNEFGHHADMSGSNSMYPTMSNSHQPLSSAKVYGINQIGVATTLPHVAENNFNWNNQGTTSKRTAPSGEGDMRMETSENRNRTSSIPAVQSEPSEIDMLRDLQMRRHHLENQVSKIQNLHTASSSLMDNASNSVGVEGASTNIRTWGGSDVGEEERMGQVSSDNSIRNKVATVNVMKAELERLKNMLRTVDSIQSNFGVNSTMDGDNVYENETQATHENGPRNQNRISESSANNPIPLSRRDSSSSTKQSKEGQLDANQVNKNVPAGLLSRLQNCITTSNKRTNVNESHQPASGEYMGSELLAIQQLTDELRQAAHGLSHERRQLKHVSNKDACTSSSSSIKSDDKRRTNSSSGGNMSSAANPGYPSYVGPIERKQLVLKAELEAKKRQLERLMSKDVDHRTNQQAAGNEDESSKEMISGDVSMMAVKSEPSCSYQNLPVGNDTHNGYYSSEQDDDEGYLALTNNTQMNINQSVEEPSQKEPSRDSSPDNLKDEPCCFGDSTQSLDGSFMSQTVKHNKLQINNKPSSNKERNKGMLQMRPPLAPTTDMFHNQAGEIHRSLPEVCLGRRSSSQDGECLRVSTQPLPDCFMGIPTSTNTRTKEECDVSNISNPSSSSSGGDRDPVPPPMSALPMRQRHVSNKSNRDNMSTEDTPPHWNSPQAESQISMWWHNKANQLQQQLELTTNLCQSLLQDKRTNQTSPSTLNNFPNSTPPFTQNIPNNVATMLPGISAYQSNPTLNVGNVGNSYYPFGGLPLPLPGYLPMDMASMWSMQQQQIAAQHQVAAAAWGSAQCIQHLLTQQREISMLRTTLSNLEERLQLLNLNTPRAHSTPPNINCPDSFVARTNFPQMPQNVWTNNQFNNEAFTNVQPSHSQNRAPVAKLVPSSQGAADHYTIQQLPANFSSCNTFQHHDSFSDQIGSHLSAAPNNMSGSQQFFNNSPHASNIVSNQIGSHLLQNNRNPNSLTNVTQHVASMNNVPLIGQPLTGQNMALNNQVPPGNRANNYWDNFRSYSRQNLLSGNTKVNAGIALTHSPHPLVERSHNSLHTSTPPGSSAAAGLITNTQVTNTPKRDVNLQGNSGGQPDNDSTLRRGRRNLSQDIAYSTAPPDVLNVNQNIDVDQNQAFNILSNTEIPNDNRLHNLHNVNINISNDPVPEIIQAHSNNLNLPRSYGAYKKKSSTKLPAKNTCNTRNYSTNSIHNRNVEQITGTVDINPNLASTSSESNQEKSTTKLFDLLRENVYTEVTALISANESHPHFLIQLFRDLQQISSDPLRQRALESIQELVSHYLSNVHPEQYEINDNTNILTGPVQVDHHEEPSSGLQIDNQIVKFMLAHHADRFTTELIDALGHVIVATIGDDTNDSYIHEQLKESLVNYLGCEVSSVSDRVIMTISTILMSLHNKVDQQITDEIRECENKTESSSSVLQHSTESSSQACCVHDEAVGPLYLDAGSQAKHDEASGMSHSPQRKETSGGFVPLSDLKIDLIENVDNYNGDLAEADQSRHGSETAAASTDGTLETFLPDVVDTEEQTPAEAEAEWLGLDHVPTRLQMDDNPENQSDGDSQA